MSIISTESADAITPTQYINSPMHIVDGIAPVVFRVPTEAGEAHSNVNPRHLRTKYNLVTLTTQPQLAMLKQTIYLTKRYTRVISCTYFHLSDSPIQRVALEVL